MSLYSESLSLLYCCSLHLKKIISNRLGILVSQTAKTVSTSQCVKYDVMEEKKNYKQYLTMHN